MNQERIEAARRLEELIPDIQSGLTAVNGYSLPKNMIQAIRLEATAKNWTNSAVVKEALVMYFNSDDKE